MKPLLGNILGAVQNNASTQSGAQNLLSALTGGGHQKYVDNIGSLADEATTNDGNGILGHLFGSKDVSRQVANNASQASGVDSGILKKMLPVVASLAMGAMSKGESQNNLMSGLLGSVLGGGSASSNNGGGSLLGSLAKGFLDKDGDGNVVDDLLGGLLKKV